MRLSIKVPHSLHFPPWPTEEFPVRNGIAPIVTGGSSVGVERRNAMKTLMCSILISGCFAAAWGASSGAGGKASSKGS